MTHTPPRDEPPFGHADDVREAERQRILAALAAGVAHEINNPLSGILQSAQLLSRSLNLSLERSQARMEALGLTPEEQAHLKTYFESQNLLKFADIIQDCGERASAMIGGLLGLMRRRPFGPEPIAPAKLIEQALFFIKTDGDVRKRVEWQKLTLTVEVMPELPDFSADIQSVQVVLLAWLKRALFAAAQRAESGLGMRITIRVSAREDRLGLIRIEDNGAALPAEELEAAAAPFDTLPVGLARQLALARHTFCDLHPGSFAVTNSEGEVVGEFGLPFIKAPKGMLR